MLDMTYPEFLERVEAAKLAIAELDTEKEWDEDRDEYCIGDETIDEAKESLAEEHDPSRQLNLYTCAAILDASPYANYHQVVANSFPANDMSAEEIIRVLAHECFMGHVKES